MSAQTNIEWTDRTWNPIRGCSRVSAGCVNCYAERQAVRQQGPGRAYEGLVRSTPAGPRWTGAVRVAAEVLEDPIHWRTPRRIFVNSMSDLFHEGLTFEQIADVFRVMAYPECDRHTFQILTKRPQRMLDFFTWAREQPHVAPWPDPDVVLRNVWLGVSVEDQARADERIPLLLQTPAAVRFLSVEPLLGQVDLTRVRSPHGGTENVLRTAVSQAARDAGIQKLNGIDWVIVGGESGPGARPCDVGWIGSIVEQCAHTGVACFVKQVGAHPLPSVDGVEGPWAEHVRFFTDADGSPARLRDPKGGDPLEWPEGLRVREFPEVSR